MAASLDAFRIRALEQLARGAAPERVLDEICRFCEGAIEGSIVGVTILDRAARVFEAAIFPSLPAAYCDALRGAVVDQRPGSCALAVYEGRAVTSDDVENDLRFQDGWRALSLTYRMRSIQSRPIIGEHGAALGTLVVAFPSTRPLDSAEEEVARVAEGLAEVALWRRRIEAQRQLVMGELQHRTRNLFATIGAVVYSTLRGAPDPVKFRSIFDGRLAALLKAHTMLLDAAEVDLRSMLGDLLAPYAVDHDIDLSGPTIHLGSEAAAAFNLAFHELATNAAKYGSFSKPGGAVRVTWDVRNAENGGPSFSLDWREHGGPTVKKPGRTGFGHTAITKSLANAVDGVVELDYQPGGLLCSIQAPMSPRLGALARY